MKIFLNIVLFVTTLLVGSCGATNENSSELKGDFRTKAVGEPFVYFSAHPNWRSISKMIKYKTPDRDTSNISNNSLAWKIYSVSYCFQIDPYLFTSLIYQESAFNERAVSRTGAAGLTQFTTIAIKEVNDQLGLRGSGYARRSTTEYFNKTITTCVVPHVGLRRWNNLWEQANTLRDMRDRLKFDVNKSLVYGAVHLKTQLAVVKAKFPTYPMKVLYREALMRYNGDPLEKDRYQKNIFRNGYRFAFLGR